MTTSTMAAVAASAASEAIDALAASAASRARDAARPDDARAFGRVLAAETEAAGASASIDTVAAVDPTPVRPDPRATGRPDVPGATDPQPDHGRDDEHAVGRTRSARGRDAATTADAAGDADASGDAHAAGEASASDSAAPAGEDAASNAGSNAATMSDGSAPAKHAGHEKGRAERAGDENEATPKVAVPPIALVAPAVVPGTPGAASSDDKSHAGTAADPCPANAATPAVPATPATPASKTSDGIAVPASPATPAEPANRTAVMPSAAPNALADTRPATDTPADPRAVPSATTGATLVADAAATATANVPLGTAPGRVSPARRGVANGGAKAADPSATASTPESGTNAAAAPVDATDAARARASIARIVGAAREAGASAEHRADGSATPAAPAVPATPAPAPVPPSAAALATAGAQAQRAEPAIPATPASAAASAAIGPSAADRVALEAVDRIRATVTAGVPGLESRIDDPELGAIRIVVSARFGETIHAEIVARDPAAARELASGIDRALAAGAALPGNIDLRVRAETAGTTRSESHPSPGEHGRSGEHAHQAPSDAGREPGQDRAGTPGRDADRRTFTSVAGPLAASRRARVPEPTPITVSATPGALRPGTALDVRA